MGEFRTTFSPESSESGKLKVNMGRQETVPEVAPESSWVGREFLQRDSGKLWKVFDEFAIETPGLKGETMVRLKAPEGETVNKVKSHMEEILAEDNGAWQPPPQRS